MINNNIHYGIIIAALISSLHCNADNKYPYQAPDRFSSKYQKSNYCLAGDIYFYTPDLPQMAQIKHFETTSPLINPSTKDSHRARFSPDTKYNLFSLFYRKGEDKECVAYTLPKPINENTRIIFNSPDNVLYPTILVNGKITDNKIIVYVGNPQNKNMGSSKLTFDINNFERYMKTTAWFNSRKELGDRLAWRDSAITFGFAINADNFNFNVPQSVAQIFSLNMVEITGALIFDCDRYQYIKTITPFTETMKIAETNTKNSIDDLYKPHTINWHGTEIIIPAIVTLEDMSATDFTTFQELSKQGNSN